MEISKLDLKILEKLNDKATYFRARYDSTRVTWMKASVQNWNRMWISSIVAMELLVFISTLQGIEDSLEFLNKTKLSPYLR